MLHLTKPCAKWKVLSLTKPKGKIYKTKSLGNYITSPLSYSSYFNSLARWRYLSFFSLSFNFTLWLAETAKSTIRQVLFFLFFFFFFFFFDYLRFRHLAEIPWTISVSLVFWPGLGDSFESQNIQENFMHLIFLNGLWFVSKPFACMVKFQFLAQFPVDYLSHPVVFSHLVLLR